MQMNTVKNTKEVQQILEFLEQIGISVVEKELPEDTFLPGITIGSNCLEIDFNQLKYPGDILHEAGHLAVTPSTDRPLIGTDAMPKEWPTQGDEIVSMLWSFAALTHLQLPIEFVFHPYGYKNESSWLIENYSQDNFIGLPLLEWMEMCYTKEKAALIQKEAFPKMQKWLRD